MTLLQKLLAFDQLREVIDRDGNISELYEAVFETQIEQPLDMMPEDELIHKLAQVRTVFQDAKATLHRYAGEKARRTLIDDMIDLTDREALDLVAERED